MNYLVCFDGLLNESVSNVCFSCNQAILSCDYSLSGFILYVIIKVYFTRFRRHKMKLVINGKEEKLDEENLTVSGLLAKKDVKMPEMVTVELNGDIIERDSFDATQLKEDDAVELLYFMGGG